MGANDFKNREVTILDQSSHIQFGSVEGSESPSETEILFYEKIDSDGVPLSLVVEDDQFTINRGSNSEGTQLETFLFSDVVEPKFDTPEELATNLFRIFNDIPTAGVSGEVYGEVHMHDNATETIIATSNTPVKVLGITSAGKLNKFIHTNNRLTYIGSETIVFPFSCTISASRVGGGSEDYTFYLAINDVVQNKTHIRRTLTSTGGSISLTSLLELETNDYVELWVENNTGTGDTLIEDMNYNTLI